MRAIQLSLLTLTLAMFSILYHQIKGLGFKKGVWVWHFMPGISCPGTPLAWSPFLEVLRLPSSVLSPLSILRVGPPELLPAVGNHGWSDLGCHSDNSTCLPVEHPWQLWWGVWWTLWLCLWSHLGHCHWHIPPVQHFLLPGTPLVQRGLWMADWL